MRFFSSGEDAIFQFPETIQLLADKGIFGVRSWFVSSPHLSDTTPLFTIDSQGGGLGGTFGNGRDVQWIYNTFEIAAEDSIAGPGWRIAGAVCNARVFATPAAATIPVSTQFAKITVELRYTYNLNALPVVVAWVDGTSYQAGDYVTFSGSTYQCLVDHTSTAGGINPGSPSGPPVVDGFLTRYWRLRSSLPETPMGGVGIIDTYTLIDCDCISPGDTLTVEHVERTITNTTDPLIDPAAFVHPISPTAEILIDKRGCCNCLEINYALNTGCVYYDEFGCVRQLPAVRVVGSGYAFGIDQIIACGGALADAGLIFVTDYVEHEFSPMSADRYRARFTVLATANYAGGKLLSTQLRFGVDIQQFSGVNASGVELWGQHGSWIGNGRQTKSSVTYGQFLRFNCAQNTQTVSLPIELSLAVIDAGGPNFIYVRNVFTGGIGSGEPSTVAIYFRDYFAAEIAAALQSSLIMEIVT